MTNLTLKNALVVSQSGGEGIYEITLTCRQKDVAGVICEATNLDVEIKSQDYGHRD